MKSRRRHQKGRLAWAIFVDKADGALNRHVCDSVESFEAGFGPHAQDVMADIPNYAGGPDRRGCRGSVAVALTVLRSCPGKAGKAVKAVFTQKRPTSLPDPRVQALSTWARTRELRIPTGRGSGYREADHEGVTAFTAFTGFHPTDQGNYVRSSVRAPGGGGCVYALPPLIKGGKGGEAGDGSALGPPCACRGRCLRRSLRHCIEKSDTSRSLVAASPGSAAWTGSSSAPGSWSTNRQTRQH